MVKAASLNFALVFGAGFVLGTIRVLWLVPAVGPRTAELFEMPIMLAVNILSARWVTQHGLSFRQYVEAFDPVAGTTYFVMLGLFALMPWFVVFGRRPKRYVEQPS
jgi:hypothetical protein